MRHTLNAGDFASLKLDLNDPAFAPSVQAPKSSKPIPPPRVEAPMWTTWALVAVLFITAGAIVLTTAITAAARNRPIFPVAPATVNVAGDQRFILELEVTPLAKRHAYCLSHLAEVAAVRQDPDTRLMFIALMRVQ